MANEILYASPVTNYLQGQQIAQQNQMAQQQQQANAFALQQAQTQADRENQFRTALQSYLQGGTNGLAGNMLANPGQSQAGSQNGFQQMLAADPEKAMQLQQLFRQQQEAQHQKVIQDATEAYKGASAVYMSAAPAALARFRYPDAVAQWSQAHGKSPDELTDDEAKWIARNVMDQTASIAGITTKFTNPEAGQVNGQDVFFQTDETTGQTRVLPGVSPRPQKPQVQIDMGQKFEGASERAFGEAEGKAFGDVLQRGQDAQDKAATLRAMKENPAITGPTQDFRAAANSFFADLGVPLSPERIGQISNLAQYKAIQNQLVLTEQLKQKGPQTESDAKRIAESFGKTSNIQEANKLILNYQLALAERESLLAQRAEEYRQQTGKIDGWRKELRQYVRETPLAGIDPQSKRLVFWNEFIDGMKEHNPQMSEEDIMAYWKKRYGGR